MKTLSTMIDALQAATASSNQPAIWLLSPAALELLKEELEKLPGESPLKAEDHPQTLLGLPYREIDTWSWGWMLLSASSWMEMQRPGLPIKGNLEL